MSERFYQELLSFFLNLGILLIIIFVTCQLGIVYVQTLNPVVYGLFVGLLIFSLFYGMRFYRAYCDFQAHIYLLIPEPESRNPGPEPVDVEVEGRPLKVCLCYQQGSSMAQIGRDMGMPHPTQVSREMRKGLTRLLEVYREYGDNGKYVAEKR